MTTSQGEPEFVMVDTSSLSHLTKSSPVGRQYETLIGSRLIAVSLVAVTELNGFPWGDARKARLDALLAKCVIVPISGATGIWFNVAAAKRRTIAPGASDNDLWIVAGACEHGVPLVTHDRAQAALAASMGVDVLTAL